MSSLLWLALGLGVLLILVFVSQRLGASKEAERSAKKSSDIKDKQIEAALDRPNTKSELVDRLRNRGL